MPQPALSPRTTRINRIAIGDSLRRSAARRPDKTALIAGERRYSYRELDAEVNRFANHLLGLGLGRGDTVATLCLNSCELVIAAYGIAKAGLVWVPINALLQGEALRYILGQVEAKLVIADDELLPRTWADIVALCPRLLVIPATGTPQAEGRQDPLFASALAGQPDTEPEVEIAGDDLAQIMYTSGTTARQKGVMVSHQAVYFASLANVIEADIRRDDVLAAVMPIFHCAQHTLLATTLGHNGTVVIVRRFEPEAFMGLVAAHRISWVFMLPMMYRALLDHPKRAGFALGSLRYCMYGMAPIDRATLNRLLAELCPTFALGSGQTEAYPAACVFKPEFQRSKTGPYWGEPALIDDMAIMDDDGRLLPTGEVGELVMRGPNVMLGYYKDAEASAQASRFGWHHTGDLCRFDADGLLVFVDRKKDMIKTGGENVASITVETALLGHPAVANVVAVGLAHRHWIEAVTAFVVRKPDAAGLGDTADEAALIEFCKRQLGRHEVPKRIVFLDQLPATATGKIQKNVLRERYSGLYDGAPD